MTVEETLDGVGTKDLWFATLRDGDLTRECTKVNVYSIREGARTHDYLCYTKQARSSLVCIASHGLAFLFVCEYEEFDWLNGA